MKFYVKSQQSKLVSFLFFFECCVVASFALSTLSHMHWCLTCCNIGLMYFSGNGENLFCFKKSYKFCSSISNTKQVWFLCWKHSKARTKLNSSAFSWLSRDKMDTSIWPCLAYDGWFFRILIATMSLVPFFQHLTTWPKVPRPRNSRTCWIKKN